MSNKIKLEVPNEISYVIVQCFSKAREEIREYTGKQNFITKNGIPFQFWDLLNNAIDTAFNSSNFKAYKSKRGRWRMIFIYDKNSKYLYVLMREQRYKELHNNINKREKMHYVDILTKAFNRDLKAPIEQLSFFSIEFDNEDKVEIYLQKLIDSINKDGAIIEHHVLLLFNQTAEYELTSIRAVMVDTNLNIVSEQNLSSYISIEESTVVEKVDKTNPAANNPTLGLKLTAKADARKKTHPLKKAKKEEDAK
ncbi:DUF5986 family protein [Clostridioides difficile]|uniref:DUF5986 family protein n=1 Tax=Clostridioides difficile TaxID=1496 RepID=UPI00038DA86E|nr:DUF5986 family protein [Clostridioides difficile]QVW56776.1 hypothetical protein [Clostridioides phage phiCD418]AXU30885.1 hypothetical protein CDIF102860_01296 [Clostridioides difficile]AXU34673.1 hypothetical protein CDIF102978_01296 [Clostridioides difficile]EGT3679908.1 hypothetical protein [Clostridioides difficile]EGT3809380.1 hypothetical protein [Clostridioides difficile]